MLILSPHRQQVNKGTGRFSHPFWMDNLADMSQKSLDVVDQPHVSLHFCQQIIHGKNYLWQSGRKRNDIPLPVTSTVLISTKFSGIVCQLSTLCSALFPIKNMSHFHFNRHIPVRVSHMVSMRHKECDQFLFECGLIMCPPFGRRHFVYCLRVNYGGAGFTQTEERRMLTMLSGGR